MHFISKSYNSQANINIMVNQFLIIFFHQYFLNVSNTLDRVLSYAGMMSHLIDLNWPGIFSSDGDVRINFAGQGP